MKGLGVALPTFVPDLSFQDMVDLAVRAEELGYERFYTTESLTDTLAIDMAIALATRRILVGSFLAIIYHRHPLVAYQGAVTIGDLSGGRFVLGLGVGHGPRLQALGLNPGRPLEDMRRYVQQVKGLAAGERVYPLPRQMYLEYELGIRRPRHRLPVHIGAVGPGMAELAGEVADGAAMYMVPVSAIPVMRERVAQGARKVGRDPSQVELVLGLHLLLSDDLEKARHRARQALTYWVGLPAYNRAIRVAGFEDEARRIREAFERGDMEGIRSNISDELVDEFCAVGPPRRCLERVEAFRQAGVDAIVLMIDPVEEGRDYRQQVEHALESLARISA
jgi:alkanesulfonate monooxygenase SsuD/methylene tetrahydromethanopterin reductase-like flavin-dependent oxidoreductase (luciferase family)